MFKFKKNFYCRYYAKRCFLSLIENLCKHMITVKDSVLEDCKQFLEHCEGKATTNCQVIQIVRK